MSRSAADLIEGYVARLTAELVAVGAAEADDLAAEVRSMLAEAAGDDPERAAAEIASLGEPADLAAGILAERGLTADGAMSAAEWWRMGVAVPIDIAIGASVPIAVLVLLVIAYLSDPRLASPGVIGFGMLFVASLAWAWHLWRPWRVGGPRLTPGMAIMRLSVVRAPGFWRVVRSEDLAALGLAGTARSRLLPVAWVLLAAACVTWALLAAAQLGSEPDIDAERNLWAGSNSSQRAAVRAVAQELYAAVIASDTVGAGALVAGDAADQDTGVAALLSRSASDRLVSADVTAESMVATGLWTVVVQARAASGTVYTDTLTVSLSLVTDEHGYVPRWVVTRISGAGCASGG